MRRRLFLRTGTASAAALALAACGGGGGGGGNATDLATGVSTGTTGATGSTATTRRAVPGPDAYPFGSRLDPYVAGIRPNAGVEQMDATVRAAYDGWKAR